MKIVTFIFCIVSYITLVPFVMGTNTKYTIVNLSTQTTGTVNGDISTSLREVLKTKEAEFKINEPAIEKHEELKIRANSSKTILEMDETQHLIINTNKFYHADNHSEIFDYKINSYIDQGILPMNYYSGYTSISNRPNIMSCDYNNTIPIFGYSNISKVMKSVVHGIKYNIGLDENNKMVFFTLGNNSNYSIKKPSEIGLNSSDNDLTFLNLFYPKTINNYYGNDFILFALFENFTIQLFKVIDNSEQFSISKSTEILLKQSLQKINQISYNNKYFYIATNIGVIEVDRQNTNNQTIILENHNIMDLIVNKQTVYAISQSNTPGLYIMNTNDSTSSMSLYFSHPHLIKFDYLLDNYTNHSSSYYVGIAVDNQPPSYNEVLIELIANTETSPKINKIFITTSNIKITDIVTDISSYYSYIYDRETKNLYTITRAVPNFQNSFSYMNSFKDIFSGSSSSNDDHLFIVSLLSYINVLMIQEDNFMFIGMNLITFSQTLQCVFHKGGKYIERVTEGYDCSTQNELKGCLTNIDFYVNVTEEEERVRVGLWIALVIGIIVVLLIIGGVLFFTFRKKSSQGQNVEVEQKDEQKDRTSHEEDFQKRSIDDKDGIEVVEANFENKI